MHFRVTGEWNGEPFNRVIEAENINDCYNHWMIWAQIAHADVTNIRIEELKEHQAAWICPYISRHLLSLNPLLACCRRYSRGER